MKNLREKVLFGIIAAFFLYKFRNPIIYSLMKNSKFRYTEDIRVSMSTDDFEEEQHNLVLHYELPLNIEVWYCQECKHEFIVSWNELIEKFVITLSDSEVCVHRIGGIAFVFPELGTEKETESSKLKKILGDLGEHI